MMVLCECVLAALLAAGTGAGQSVELHAGKLSGLLHDNASNAGKDGAGFNPLRYMDYPNATLYRPQQVGLNFEHIFNGMAADYEPSFFTPRVDKNRLDVHSETSAAVVFEPEDCTWGMGSSMTYTVKPPHYIDLTFRCTLTKERYGMGYAAMMWASYMRRARSREIHFIGKDGDKEGWITFGEMAPYGVEMGTVPFAGVERLPFEEGARELNIVEHPTKSFTKPFYYGLVDGDNDLGTTDDTLVYIMMFDQTTPIRFAMWNFIPNEQGEPDTHSPAWDWHYVIRKPEMGKEYGYRARVVIKPWVDRADVVREYEAWCAER